MMTSQVLNQIILMMSLVLSCWLCKIVTLSYWISDKTALFGTFFIGLNGLQYFDFALNFASHEFMIHELVELEWFLEWWVRKYLCTLQMTAVLFEWIENQQCLFPLAEIESAGIDRESRALWMPRASKC